MKMQLQMNELVLTGKMRETNVSVGDPRMILHHLIKSVYQYPEITMVQEIASNARDANVEAGRGHLPIEITVPNTFEPNLVIADHGIGISPDRMYNVFINVGDSTKRDENFSDGAFGIGSKIPLAYADQFHVKTVVNEDGMLVRRRYAVVKKDDFSIKLVEIGDPHIINNSDDACDQHTGTAITIPVKKDDIAKVRQAVIDKTDLWQLRPIIHGANAGEMVYPTRNWFYECNEFRFALGTDHYDHGTIEAVVNGVRYPVKRAGHANDVGVNYEYFKGKIYLNFKVGELTPALNRESLQYDDRTKALISKRVADAIKTIKDKVSEIVNNEPTFLKAWSKSQSFRDGGWSDNNGTWHGHKLSDYLVVVGEKDPITSTMKFDKCPVTFMSFTYSHDGKMKDRRENNFGIGYINKLVEAKLPILYTEKKGVNGNATKFLLNTKNDPRRKEYIVLRGTKADCEKFLTDNHLEEIIPLMECIDTCGFIKQKRIRGVPATSKVVNKWVATGNYHGKMQTCGTFDYTDPKDCGYYYIFDRKNGEDSDLDIGNGKLICNRDIVNIVSALGVPIFGVAPGNVKYLNKAQWKPLCEVFKSGANPELLAELNAHQEHIARLKDASHSAFNLGLYRRVDANAFAKKSPMRLWIEAVKSLPATKYPDNKFIKNTHAIERVLQVLIEQKMIKSIHTEAKIHPAINLYKNIDDAYPMLRYVSDSGESKHIATVTEYIKMCDTLAKV